MRTDTELRLEGMTALLEKPGEVDAARFVALLSREPFDYTRWRRNLWPDVDATTLSREAMAARQPKK